MFLKRFQSKLFAQIFKVNFTRLLTNKLKCTKSPDEKLCHKYKINQEQLENAKDFCRDSGIDLEFYLSLKEALDRYNTLFNNKNSSIAIENNDKIFSKKSEVFMWDNIKMYGENRFKFDCEIDVRSYSEHLKTSDLFWLSSLINQNLQDMSKIRGNDILLISYANGSLMEEDDLKNIFNILKNQQNKTKNLDIVIRSEGGTLFVSHLMLHKFYDMYENVNFLIPYKAYSAATLLCMGSKEIIMHPNAIMSPYDPQLEGLPANIHFKHEEDAKKKESYKMSIKDTKKSSRDIILKYMLGCRNTDILIDYRNFFTHIKQIVQCRRKYFFALKITHYFTDYFSHCSHNVPIFFEDIERLGINVNKPNQELEELMWENEVLLSYLFNNSSNVKFFSNSDKFINILRKNTNEQ